MFIYTVFDKAAETFGPVFEAETDTAAGRSFTIMMAKQPENLRPDFDLYCIGERNMETSVIESMVPEIVRRGDQYVGMEDTQKWLNQINQPLTHQSVERKEQ